MELPGLYGLALIVNMAALLWATGIAMRLRTIQAGPSCRCPSSSTLFFAPVYVPLTLLSGWIHGVASVNPVTYFLEAGRSFVSGDTVHAGLAYALRQPWRCLPSGRTAACAARSVRLSSISPR